MALIPSKAQRVLAGLLRKLGAKAEDAYRARDRANENGEQHAQSYAAGEAHAYSEAEASVREAQAEADT